MLIAEVAQAHDGSLGTAHAYIDALRSSGVDAVKFQTHIAEAESSAYEPFRVKFSYQDATRYAYWKRMEFTAEQWQGLKQHCEEAGMEFISSPFSIAAVNLLESLNVRRYKIGSGEVTNTLLLQRIALTGKPVMISSGLSSWAELDAAVDYFKPFGNEVSVFQCTTAYPTTPEQWGLNLIQEIKKRYRLRVGFSDHSGDIYACLAATALGADMVEFHVCFDRRQFGPDSAASITISEVEKLAEGIRQIRKAQQHCLDKTTDTQTARLKTMFGKSLAVNKNLAAGHVLQIEDLETKKPANKGIAAGEFQQTLGKALNRNLAVHDFLNYQDLTTG